MTSRVLKTMLLMLALCSIPAWGLERFPPPDFEGGYTFPTTTTPGPEGVWHEWMDVVVLAAALCVGAYLVLKKRSRAWVFGLMLFSLAYFGFYRKGCICPIGAIQNVTLTIFDAGYALPVTALLFFILPLVFTLFFGRIFCGSVCPLGAIQDLVLLKPVAVPRWLESGLRLIAYAYLSFAVLFAATGSAFLICRYDPFVAIFRLTGNMPVFVLGGCFLVIGLFVGRPYCRFVCPYSVILRQFSRLSKWRVTITPTDCISCRLCEDACPFDVIEGPEPDWPQRDYARGRRTVLFLIMALPVLILLGAGLGNVAAPGLARMHPTVQVAQRVLLEAKGSVTDTTDQSDAFRASGRTPESLYEEADQVQSQFAVGSIAVGVFLGLVLGLKLVRVSVRRDRAGYEAQQAGCVACARCYKSCPNERIQRQSSKELLGAVS
ncbi:MAG: 4Fe-4S binding protein [Planctomycetes bacterium]|nr:4Fe-4S binding protein [Planctomycetota bacterium]